MIFSIMLYQNISNEILLEKMTNKYKMQLQNSIKHTVTTSPTPQLVQVQERRTSRQAPLNSPDLTRLLVHPTCHLSDGTMFHTLQVQLQLDTAWMN